MSKFIKKVLITAGCFLAAGVIFMIIGSIGGAGRELDSDQTGNAGILHEIYRRFQWFPVRVLTGDESGLVIQYGDVEYDKAYDIAYGDFTDEDIRDTDIWNLEIEVGDGNVVIEEGDVFQLRKEGAGSCQYYVEGDTFYLKQKGVVSGDSLLVLTVPKGTEFEGTDIVLGAGELNIKGNFAADWINMEVGAGKAWAAELNAEVFEAEIGAGELTVEALNTKDCDASVSMGSILVKSGVVSGNLNAEVNMGSMDFRLSDFYDNHSYEVDCSMGDISVKNASETKSYSGLGSEMEFSGKNPGDSHYDLSCDMGSIFLSFDR